MNTCEEYDPYFAEYSAELSSVKKEIKRLEALVTEKIKPAASLPADMHKPFDILSRIKSCKIITFHGKPLIYAVDAAKNVYIGDEYLFKNDLSKKYCFQSHQFTLVYISACKVAIQCCYNTYLVCRPDGRVICEKINEASEEHIWKIVKCDKETCGFQSVYNTYLCTEPEGFHHGNYRKYGTPVAADRTWLREWETYKIKIY